MGHANDFDTMHYWSFILGRNTKERTSSTNSACSFVYIHLGAKVKGTMQQNPIFVQNFFGTFNLTQNIMLMFYKV